MATRYFAATDGKNTYFRASPSRVYLSLSVDPTRNTEFGWTLHRDGRGAFPAREITRKEYTALIALKNARGLIEQAKYEAKYGHPWHRAGVGQFLDAPRDSWVANSELPEAKASADRAEADAIIEKHNREGGPALLRELFKI